MASKPTHYHGVGFLLFVWEHVRQAFVEGGSFFAHAACGGEDKRGEHSMLHILHPLIVFSFLADSRCLQAEAMSLEW